MTIHNNDNIAVVNDFDISFKQSILQICPRLGGMDIYCRDIDVENISAEFSQYTKKDFDSPYSTVSLNGKRYIFRASAMCANYTLEEENALLAHEFGHVIGEVSDIHFPQVIMEEIFCDNIAHSLDLSAGLISWIDRISQSGCKNSNILFDRKVIAENVYACKSKIKPVNTLDDFLGIIG